MMFAFHDTNKGSIREAMRTPVMDAYLVAAPGEDPT
jgi:hypothetical protein